MRVSVEIDEKSIARIKKYTQKNKVSPAINSALNLFLREMDKKELLRDIMEGRTDYSMTNEELERRLYGTD